MDEIFKISEDKFKKFIQVVTTLSGDENTLDLIASAGNTGIVTLRFVELIYEKLGINFPLLPLPVLRFIDNHESNDFDNSSLIPKVKEELIRLNIKKLDKIAFIDDEIRKANSASKTITLIVKAAQDLNIPVANPLQIYIIAEDHCENGILPPLQISIPYTLNHYFFSQVSGETDNHALFKFLYIPAQEIQNHTKGLMKMAEIESHNFVNILLGLGVRPKFNVNEPSFTYEYTKIAEKAFPEISKLREEAYDKIRKLIDEELSTTK